MITRATQVITDASACRCFDVSERTSASVSRAFASIRSMIFPPSQVAKRVSRIAPITSRTISSPLPRAHRPMSGRRVILENMGSYHGRTTVGKYGQAGTGPGGRTRPQGRRSARHVDRVHPHRANGYLNP